MLEIPNGGLTPEMLHDFGLPITQASTIPEMPESQREAQLEDKRSNFQKGFLIDKHKITKDENEKLVLPDLLYYEAAAYAGVLGVNRALDGSKDVNPTDIYVKSIEFLELALKGTKPNDLAYELNTRVENEIDSFVDDASQKKEKKFLTGDIESLNLDEAEHDFIFNIFNNKDGSSTKKTNTEKRIEKAFGSARMEQIAVRMSLEDQVDMEQVPEGKSRLISENVDKFQFTEGEVFGILTSWTSTKVEIQDKYGLTSQTKLDAVFNTAKKITGAKTNTQLMLMLVKDGLIQKPEESSIAA